MCMQGNKILGLLNSKVQNNSGQLIKYGLMKSYENENQLADLNTNWEIMYNETSTLTKSLLHSVHFFSEPLSKQQSSTSPTCLLSFSSKNTSLLMTRSI